jgi:hypothetical protein
MRPTAILGDSAPLGGGWQGGDGNDRWAPRRSEGCGDGSGDSNGDDYQPSRPPVTVQKDGQTANAANILELMSLGAAQGTELVLSAKGSNAEEALNALARLFANEFEILYKD